MGRGPVRRRSGGIQELIYEMRFDEATALYAEFGPFYVGVRLPAGGLDAFLSGSAG